MRHSRRHEPLARIGYDGFVSLELEVADPENTDTYVREARAILAGMLASCASSTQ